MKYYWMVLLSLLVESCAGFLEPRDQSLYVPKNAVALDEMLFGSAYDMSLNMMSILTILDDDVCCTDSAGVVYMGDTKKFATYRDIFSWQPNFWRSKDGQSNELPNYWSIYYTKILGTNAALDYVDDVSGKPEEIKQVKAQAFALRAFYYFQLVNLFGEPYSYNKKALGVPLKITSAIEDKDIPRNTVEEVYDQILKDLEEAEKLYESLPFELQFKRWNYRTSLPMLYLLKSRVYLYMEDWENAMTYAQKVIDNSNFSLIDLNTLPPSSRESPYYNFISMESTECIWVFEQISNYLTFLDASTTVYFENATNQLVNTIRYVTPFFNASSELLKSFEQGDLRKEHYIVKGYAREKISDYYYVDRPVGYSAYGKFAINSSYSPDRDINNFACAFRLAEAYLNLAEAAAQLKKDKIALDALNALRIKRFAPEYYEEISGISGEDLVTKIRKERRLELCFEGHRWFDLRRYGMPAFSRTWKIDGMPVQTYTLEKNDPAYTLPIPPDVLERNRSLVQNKLPNPR